MEKLHHNEIVIEGSNFCERWRLWGHPEGVGCSGCERSPFNRQQEPLLLQKLLKGDIYGPLETVRNSIPAEVLKAVYPFLQYNLELIELAECNPHAFVRLARSNPALLTLLADAVANHTLWGVRFWGALLSSSWEDICSSLGLPRNWGSILAKFKDPNLCTIGYIQQFVLSLGYAGVARLVRHIPEVNCEVLQTLAVVPDAVLDCPSLLQLAAEGESAGKVAEAVATIMQLRARVGKVPVWPYRRIKDLRQLHRYCAKAEKVAVEAGERPCVRYPSPPVSPDAIWGCVTTSEELMDFAEQWQNCAISCHLALLQGHLAIYYHRSGPPLGACVVLQRESQGWRVQDVLGAGNCPVGEEEYPIWKFWTELLKEAQ